ncbi:MAG TPA: prepilin-type N-terminal cleavage/methylation domain-containing protein [Candidatus Paceibacterota bacterium]|nr:prepilin-type N-terminal cleavage/methylation domain-containing protein [Candidatus Paceibacterota bacterium]
MSIFSPHSRSFFKKPFRRLLGKGRGFTLIELLVVVAIITIMTTVLLLQQRKFDSSTLLRSLAYSIALSVRQAQVYGTSVRQDSATSGFTSDYGVFFYKGEGTSNYYIFADSGTKDHCRAGWAVTGFCSSNAGNEDVQQFKLGPGYSILKFCATTSSNSQVCTPTLDWLSIYFKRPNPDAFFATSAGGTYKSAYIQIVGPDGVTTRGITVTTTGQIIVCGVNKVYPDC